MIIKLSDRLQLMADEIKNGETMADIGTDHGFLPLYLWQNKISPEVVMCDISEPSLQKAKDAATELLPEGGNTLYCDRVGLKFRAGDGLNVLEKSEVDVITIAGMGGILITEILGSDIEKTISFRKYVFQPRNHAEKLRYWLVSNGFKITSNKLVREGKFICEIITAISPDKPHRVIPEFDEENPIWDIPNELLKDSLIRAFAKTKLRKENKILQGMRKARNVQADRIEICQKRTEFFLNILK